MQSNFSAVILSAGLGKRLLPLTENKTKAMVEIDNKPLLYYSIYNLNKIGIRNIYIVGGYKFDNLADWINKNHKNFPLMQFTLIYNDKYEEYNNCYTLKVAIDYLRQDFLILNSDILYDFNILKKIVEEKNNALVIDNVKKLGEEEMKAVQNEKGVYSLRKDNPIDKSIGEYIGITLFYKENIDILKRKMENFDYTNHKKYYEDVLMDTVKDGVVFKPVYTDGLMWTEVDTLKDLEFARNTVYKNIKEYYK